MGFAYVVNKNILLLIQFEFHSQTTTPYKDKSYDQDSADLKFQLDQLRNQNENCQAEVRMKEERIQKLLREVQNLVRLPTSVRF